MLQQMTPEEFDERWAWHLASLDDQWQIGAMIASMVHNVMQTYMAAKAGKNRVSPGNLIDPEKLIPRPAWYRRPAPPVSESHADPEHLARALGCI